MHRLAAGGGVLLDRDAAKRNVDRRAEAVATVARVAEMSRGERRQVYRRLKPGDRTALKQDVRRYLELRERERTDDPSA